MHKPWFAKLGYAYNPFTIKPAFFDDEVHGYDSEIDQLVERLQTPSMNFLEGDYGLGKTSIVEYLINELKGKFKIIHVSRNKNDRAFNYEELLRGASSGLARFFRKKAKNVILFVDETEKINDHDCFQIQKFYDEGYLLSVLFIDKKLGETRITGDIKKEIGSNVTKVKPIPTKDVVSLVHSRLDGGQELASDDVIEQVYDHSGKNTRVFLLAMEDLARVVVDESRSEITNDDVATYFGVAPKKKAKSTAAKSKESKSSDATTSDRARKADANLIAFHEDHELDYILKKYNKRLTKDNRKALTELGLRWKKDKRVKAHNRESFYKFVEKHDALKELESA